MAIPLEVLRSQIKDIDADLVRLLKKRMSLVRQIGAVKRRSGLNMVDSLREQQILEQVVSLPHDPIPTRSLLLLFRHIIRISHQIQTELYSGKLENRP